MRNLSSIAAGLQHRFMTITSNNEKHVDDFSSSSDLSIIDDPKKTALYEKGKLLPSSDKTKDAETTQGIDPVVKIYYEGPPSGEGHYIWVDYPPRQMSKKAAAKLDRIGVKVYKVKDLDKPILGGKFALKYHMIELQNPQLVAALKPIVKKEAVYLDESEHATFREPFKALYFCADEIGALYTTTPDSSPLKQQLLLLLKVMGDVFGGTRTLVHNLQTQGLISYKLAWIYYRKDTIIYYPGKDTERLFKVVDASYQVKPMPHLKIECKEILFDGKGYVWDKMDVELCSWVGNKPITKLPAYPLEFHKDPESVKKRLEERGLRVLQYQGLEYCMYTGVGYFQEGNKIEKHNVDGRILIDTFGYHKHHENLTRTGGRAHDSNYSRILSSKKEDIEDPDGTKAVQASVAILQTAKTDAKQKGTSYIKRLTPEAIAKNKKIMEDNAEYLMYISPLVKGYCLKAKLWLQFYIDDLRPMEWNLEAYDHLVYPEEQKDLVLSFVQHHNSSAPAADAFDDVIKGKGNGLVLLLSGPPGTGKTLTAEAVADKTNRPLLYMHAEDLGVNPASLGANLKKLFEMAAEWNAVCLLDECDVFLSARNPVDIARNELVSIFLREIEYFQGILFLTTNLYDSIDTAFRSRMSLHLRFNPLAPEARLLLWQKFLSRLPPMPRYNNKKGKEAETEAKGDGKGEDIPEEIEMINPIDNLSPEDLKELSLWELNGREIKCVIKTVKSWCEVKKFEFTLSRMEAGIKVTAPNSQKRGTVDTSLYDD